MLIYCFFLFTTFPSGLLGGTKRGFKDYTEYEPGNMSLIITAPHGGELTPSKQENGDPWPDRTAGCLGSSGCIWKHSCGEVDAEKCPAITESDLFTATVARDMADGIETITGLRPHVVYCRLSRSKLDANRAMGPAALSVPDAVTAYRNYTTFIAKAVSAIPGRGLLLDIHGHGHKLQRTELGYLIHGTELDSGAYDGNNSSIKSLSNFWCGNDNACSRKLIRGNWSLGHFMNEEGLRAVPSPQEPVPKVSKTSIFLSGGLTVMKYGSKEEGKIDAIQMELPQELRLNKTAWQDSRLKLAKAISGFFKINYLRDNRRTINL